MSKKEPAPTARRLRAELARLDGDIRNAREALMAMRSRRAVLRSRLSEARTAERAEAAGREPDLNRDVGGEG